MTVNSKLGSHRPRVSGSTYTANNADSPQERRLAARTTISCDGDIETVVATDFAKNGERLELHRGMVEQAVVARQGGRSAYG